MRLLERTNDGEFSLTKDFGDDIPRYAILSHTWGADIEEVTFRDLIDGTGKNKAGYDKIRFCGEQARRDSLQYFWIDTCCIDKSNNNELAEAINSMFRWYRNTTKCYVYLSDVPRAAIGINDQSTQLPWEPALRKSRWFTRGWTLQELIAPTSIEFFSKDWELLGDKKSLEQHICEITGIPAKALQGIALSDFSVAERLSWAENRETTRKEDKAYSLLGIFNVYIPLIYGEGRENAFERLREAIDKKEKSRLLSSSAQPSLHSSPHDEARQSEPELPKNVNRHFMIPIDTNSNYVERPSISDALYRILGPRTTDSGVAARRVVLYGLGGSGKTETVVRFAERNRSHYQAVFWVDCSDVTRMLDGFHSIARALNINEPNNTEQSLSNVRSWLISYNEWLLILDNLDEDSMVDHLQRNYLKAGMNGDILMTSRNFKCSIRWKSIEVANMEADEAKILLNNIVDSCSSSETEMEGLLSDLGFLPLAIDQAASFIAETGITLSQYRHMFRTEQERLLGHFPSTQYNQECRRSVMTTWELSFSRIERENIPAAKLFLLLCLLHHDQIPISILESCFNGQNHWTPSGEFDIVSEKDRWIPEDMLPMFSTQFALLHALTTLRKFSFVRYQAQKSNKPMVLRIHPLVQFWATQRLRGLAEISRDLKICCIGLVSCCLEKQDRFAPLGPRKKNSYMLEDRSLATWPWRQYSNIAMHAPRCLMYAMDLEPIPKLTAHLSLSLLQVLEYSSFFQTFELDQSFSLRLIEHVEKQQIGNDEYLQSCCHIWRLLRLGLCHCRKMASRRRTLDNIDTPWQFCQSCGQSIQSANLFLGASHDLERSTSGQLLAQSLTRIVTNLAGKKELPGQARFSLSTRSSWLTQYDWAQEEYFKVRDAFEESFDLSGYEDVSRRVALTFQNLCGTSSEEFRRSQFYATGPLMKAGTYEDVEEMLSPLVELSTQHPTHSWSHERCIIRLVEAKLQTGKIDEARRTLSMVQQAYQETGRQLRTISNSLLLKDTPEFAPNIPQKQIQVFIKGLTPRTITVQTQSTATVRSLWATLLFREGCSPEGGWRLIYGGKQLEPERFLSDYNIQDLSLLQLVLRLSGGV